LLSLQQLFINFIGQKEIANIFQIQKLV